MRGLGHEPTVHSMLYLYGYGNDINRSNLPFHLIDSIQNFYGMMTYKHEVNMHLHKELW